MTEIDDPIPPRTRRANRRFGLVLGLLCVAQMAWFIIMFYHHGMPQDRQEWLRQQARLQAQGAGAPAEQQAP